MEVCNAQFSPEWLIERLQRQTGDSICLYLKPRMLDMMAGILEDIKKANLKGYEDAIEGFRRIRLLCSGGMLAGPSTQVAWREIRGGKNIVLVYGMTETFEFLSFTNVKAGKESSLVSPYQPIPFCVT